MPPSPWPYLLLEPAGEQLDVGSSNLEQVQVMVGTPTNPLAKIERVSIEGLAGIASQETADRGTSPKGIKPPINDIGDDNSIGNRHNRLLHPPGENPRPRMPQQITEHEVPIPDTPWNVRYKLRSVDLRYLLLSVYDNAWRNAASSSRGLGGWPARCLLASAQRYRPV